MNQTKMEVWDDVKQSAIFVNGINVGSLTGVEHFRGTGQVVVRSFCERQLFPGNDRSPGRRPDRLNVEEIQAIMNEAPLLNLHLDEGLLDDSGSGGDDHEFRRRQPHRY